MTTNADIADIQDVLKGAVPKVIKANQDWLAALEKYLEPSASDETVQRELDELKFLRFADRKLDGRFSQIDTSSESFENELSNLLKETEAYLVMTNESYEHLIHLNAPLEDVPKEACDAAQKARKDLAKVVKDHSTLISRPVETKLLVPATGTEEDEDQLFLNLMLLPQRKYEYGWTTDLLAKQPLELDTSQIDNLTTSWGEVIAKPTPNLSLLLSLHKTLEKLYELLATKVTRKDADILSIDI